MTFRFEADITDVDVLYPTPLPFSIQVGELVSGHFTFEPVDAESSTIATNTVQKSSAILNLGSIVLETSEYFVRARNDIPVDDAPDQLTDDIWLGCSSSLFIACNPPNILNAPNINWRFSLPLFGDGSVLDGADIPNNPDTWNQFTPGYISLVFEEEAVADLLRIVIRVNEFSLIPEPQTSLLLVGFLSSLVSIRYRTIGN